MAEAVGRASRRFGAHQNPSGDRVIGPPNTKADFPL